jgi:diguanylate cyclase (GGDEF)-like protein/PAS domain S-box-containing protein
MDPERSASWGAALGDPQALAWIMDALPVQVFLAEMRTDGGLTCKAVNRLSAAARNCRAEDLVERPIEAVLDDDLHRALLATMRDAAASAYPAHAYAVQTDAEGRARLVHSSAVPLLRGGVVRHVIGITEPTPAVWPSGEGSRDLATALDAAPDVVARYDPQLRCVYLNRAAERVFGRARAEMLHATNREVGMPEHVAERWDTALASVLAKGSPEQFEFALDTDDGERWFHARLAPEFDADRNVTSVIATSRDVTDQRRLADALEHLAMHDPVTQLPNRRLLLDRLQPASGRAQRSGRLLALLFVDLDDFKQVNDTLGHAAGDTVLRAAAERIVGASRVGDTVVSFGGDEFVVLCEDLDQGEDAHRIADRITAGMAQPFLAGGAEVSVRASIGVAVGRGDREAEDLLHEADRLMYLQKSHRRRARIAGTG